jgi:cell division septation protein DedD
MEFYMPWQNHGDYYSFKQESITQHAPTASGVYGLFNSRHQIVIGSAANIRDALLHHRRHTNFRFSRLAPSGFTFEICPAERREHRAEELIQELQPISSSQTPIGITTLYRSWRAPNARAFKAEGIAQIQRTSNKVVAIAPKLSKAKQKERLYLNAERFGLAGALCGVIFLAIGLIGLVPHLKSTFEVVVRNSTANAESNRRIDRGNIQPARAQSLIAAETARNDAATASPMAVEPSVPTAPNAKAIISSPTESHSAAPAASTEPVALSKPQAMASAPAAKQDITVNNWSVQVMATTDKQFADNWLRKLKAKGYEAYRVDADINGKIWYRVRIGTFETRQDADNLRAELKAKEGYRDAFVTG